MADTEYEGAFLSPVSFPLIGRPKPVRSPEVYFATNFRVILERAWKRKILYMNLYPLDSTKSEEAGIRIAVLLQ